MTPRKRLWLISAVLALPFIAIALGYAVPGVRWRLEVIRQRLQGQHDDAQWGDLLRMVSPGSPFWLLPVAGGVRLEVAVNNPWNTEKDAARGHQVFDAECSQCHGSNASGGPAGPSLLGTESARLASDWSIFRTIRSGVPSTAMRAHPHLEFADIWRTVHYIETLRQRSHAVVDDQIIPPDAGWGAPVTYSEIAALHATGAEWLTYSGTYSSARHSSLSQIRADNIGSLEVAWIRQLNLEEKEKYLEVTPIVRGGAMYVTDPGGIVTALDAATGRVIWSFRRRSPDDVALCCVRSNRGVAILGDRLFVATLDAHLLALDRKTGALLWDNKIADYQAGYSITGAPLALEGKIITGVAGGEFGIRGFLDAYDPGTGVRIWRFYTVPEPGKPASETWVGDTWQRGGAPTWLTGSYDPIKNELFWGVGNPSPNYVPKEPNATNLYSNSVIVLDPSNGALKWHFQFTPRDSHDWDSAQIPLLGHLDNKGGPANALLWANRNAFYYVLDRDTGKFVHAAPFASQTWAEGIDDSGKPKLIPKLDPSREGQVVRPSVAGATNWWSPSYDEQRQIVFIPVLERASVFVLAPQKYEAGELYTGGFTMNVPATNHYTAVRAVDAASGKQLWEHRFADRKDWALASGVLSTDAGLVFGADRESLFAFDSTTGKQLWSFEAGGRVAAGPITYLSGDQQYVAYLTGRSIVAFRLRQSGSVRAPAAARATPKAP
jgi:alcohol dehydrogenase (cytochrome c)